MHEANFGAVNYLKVELEEATPEDTEAKNLDDDAWKIYENPIQRNKVTEEHSQQQARRASFLVSIFALFVSFSSRCFALLLVLQSLSDCAPISMFVSIHSTSSSLRKRGSDTRHVICVCLMVLFVF